MEQPQSQSPLKLESKGHNVKLIGRIDGPTKRTGQTTFCVIIGLFDDEDRQLVHVRADGNQVPIVFISHPIDTDDKPGIIL